MGGGAFPILFPTRRNISRGVGLISTPKSLSFASHSSLFLCEVVLKTSSQLLREAQSDTQTFFSPPPPFFFLQIIPQLSQVTNKAGCGGTGLCRGGLEAWCQIETTREMEADAESCLIAAGVCGWLLRCV